MVRSIWSSAGTDILEKKKRAGLDESLKLFYKRRTVWFGFLVVGRRSSTEGNPSNDHVEELVASFHNRWSRWANVNCGGNDTLRRKLERGGGKYLVSTVRHRRSEWGRTMQKRG